MKIGIDGRAAKWYRGTGIGTYTYQLINNLSIVDSSNQYLILLPQNTDLVLKDNFEWQLNAGFGLGSFAKIFISTGPQIAFSLGDSKILDYKYDLKNSLFSWNAGLNVRLFKHYQVGYTYNVGIGNTAELSVKDVNPLKLSEKLKNSTHKITLSYYFW